MPSVLIIEDDVDLAELTQQYLQQQGFKVSLCFDPIDGLLALKSTAFDLVLLDIMLSNLNGFETCQRIRAFSPLPILMMTAKGEVEDKVKGLSLGADDYLAKPFDPRELVARMQSLLRRAEQMPISGSELSLQTQLQLDPATMQVRYLDQHITLTSMESDVLSLLMDNENEVLSRDDILNHLRGVEAEVYSRSIDILISRLRAKLTQLSDREWIYTVRTKGYRFAAG